MCIGGTGKTREYENETRKNRLVRQQMFGLKEVSAWATETAEILPPYILYKRWRRRRRQWNKTNTDTRIQKKHIHRQTFREKHMKATYKLTTVFVFGILWFSKEFHFQYLPNWDARRFSFSFSFISYYIVLFSVEFSVLFNLINCLYDKICIRLVENVKWVLSSE